MWSVSLVFLLRFPGLRGTAATVWMAMLRRGWWQERKKGFGRWPGIASGECPPKCILSRATIPSDVLGDNYHLLTIPTNSFTIRLEDYESKLSDRTLFLVTRFSSPVGEWWDNNNGQNYRVGFRRAVVSPLVSPLNTPSGTPTASAMSSPFMSTVSLSNSAHFLTSMNATAGSPSGLAQQRTFSAPSALRYTPMTGALAGVPVISAQNGLALGGRSGTPPLCRSMSSPYPGGSPTRQPSPLIATSGSPTRSYSAPSPLANQKALPTGKDAQGRPHTLPKVHMPNSPPSPSATQTSSYIKRRLSLSNYVAPGSGPSPTAVVKPAVSAPAPSPSPPPSGSEGLVTPPNTPPSTVRARSSSLPSEFEGVPNLVEEQSTVAHGSGDVAVEKPSPTVTIIGGMSAASVDPDLPSGSESPFSPTRTTMPFVNFEGLGLSGIGGYGTGLGGGLMSPPRSRDTSEDGGSGEGGRSSPNLPILDFKAPGALKVVPSYVSSAPQDSSSPAGSTPSLTSTPSAAGSAGSAVLRSPVVATLSTLGYGGPDSGRVGTNDSSYAAFVRQWCFAQSTPPTPGVEHSPDASDDPTPKGSPPAAYSPPGGILGVGRKWNNAGYSFPGFNFGVGVSPDAGMVGGESQI